MKKTALIIISAIVLVPALAFLGLVLTFLADCTINLQRYQQQEDKNSVNIVMIADKKYVFPTRAAIKSAIINKNPETKYNFFILGVELNQKSIKNLEDLTAKNADVKVLNQNHVYRKYTTIYPHKIKLFELTRVTMFKFALPYIFPKFDKILYLDGDIIVQKDLSELYNTNLKDNYAAVIIDAIAFLPESSFGFENYFNDGVLLLNLDKMRKNHTPIKLFLRRFFDKRTDLITQEVHNLIFQPYVIMLPAKYDLPANLRMYLAPEHYEAFFKFDDIKYDTFDECVKNAVIVHYISSNKPWSRHGADYAEIWYKYAQMLDDFEEQIKKSGAKDLYQNYLQHIKNDNN